MSDPIVLPLSSRTQVIERELMAIYEERGLLVPADIVDAARPEDHPLHRYFEWDDTEAAERYRQLQAGQLVRSVKVQMQNDGDLEVRSWIAVNRDGSGYQPIEAVSVNPEQRDRALRRMQREINSLRVRFGHYQEFWEAWAQLGAGRSEEAS